MSTRELQEQLIVKIKNTKQDYILEELTRLIEFEENWFHIYSLNPEQQQLIDSSLKEIEIGEYFTDEDVQKETDEWLKKIWSKTAKISLSYWNKRNKSKPWFVAHETNIPPP